MTKGQEEPIDAIRQMNPGKNIPSGEDLAKRAKRSDTKTEESEVLLPVTERMIQEYPHFEQSLAEEIFSQIDEDNLRFADCIIGVSGDMSTLVYSVVKLVNKHRKKYAIEKSCTMLSMQLIDSVAHTSRWQIFRDLLGSAAEIEKNIIFVHYLFDHPSKYRKETSWKDTEEALEHWRASEKAKNEQVITRLAESMGGQLCQSIILPIPQKQYAKFIAEINSNHSAIKNY